MRDDEGSTVQFAFELVYAPLEPLKARLQRAVLLQCLPQQLIDQPLIGNAGIGGLLAQDAEDVLVDVNRDLDLPGAAGIRTRRVLRFILHDEGSHQKAVATKYHIHMYDAIRFRSTCLTCLRT